MLALLGEQQQRRDEDGCDIAAIDALSIFQRIDPAVGNPHRGLFGTEEENLLVRGIDTAFRFAGKGGNRAPDILGPAAWIARQEQRRECIAAYYQKQRPRERTHNS